MSGYVRAYVYPLIFEPTESGLTKASSKLLLLQDSGAHLAKTNPYSRRRGGPISKHINGLGTNKNMVMDLYGARNNE
jgi:hypothetical protein